ncbi:MAG: phospho-N-acetylmuramoyl-pentapeptide-transferase [Anaerolineales bacterium]|nr:phospho-N-acetylmuramoyl-pentapeptide-transferase [Anaerolineae bacterium]PWB51640.1 MAG: phospho-N-acetylmuramoyl-pentapeptide-transferase [Anaerolineales bacterium]
MRESAYALALAGFSFMLTIIWGEPLLRILRHLKIGESIRVDGPQRHISKSGTPTMGGVLFILPVLLITLLFNGASLLGFTMLGKSIFLPMGTMIAFGLLGSFDDWKKLRGNHSDVRGLRARDKFIIQIFMGVVISIGLRYVLQAPEVYLPWMNREFSLGYWYIPLATFLIVGFCNAVNFTDGLDGLAGMISATCFAAFGMIALLQGQLFLARFCFTLVGALFGFLWFNVHPALLIMGDVGALALGATLAVVALMTGQWILLPIIAIIPLSEMVSVVLQVSYFKLTKGKRLFKMTPLHHHFELLGWSETQVVQRFWLIGLLAAIIGAAIAIG